MPINPYARTYDPNKPAPCETDLCTPILRKKCRRHACACLAWPIFVATGKVNDSKIGVFRNQSCTKCKQEKNSCENKCRLRRA